MELALNRRGLSAAEYLEGERSSAIRHEYVDGEIFAMAGATERHNRIAMNIGFRLRAAARGGPCGVFISDMRVGVEKRNAYYYPDVMLVCDPDDNDAWVKRSPCLIAEALAPTTMATDRREKWSAYRTLPSLRYYLLASSDRKQAECYLRDEAGDWRLIRLEGMCGVDVRCRDYAATLYLDAIYEDLLFC